MELMKFELEIVKMEVADVITTSSSCTTELPPTEEE